MHIDKSIDSYTRLAAITLLVVVLGIGGLSLFMAKAMLDKIHLIKDESRNISLVNQIQDNTSKLIFALQMFILQPKEEYSQRVIDFYEKINPKIHTYINYEETSSYPESREEIRLLKQIDKQLHEIMKIHEMVISGEFTAHQLADLDKYVNRIEGFTGEINRLHFEIIARKIKKSDLRLRIIASLYGSFAFFGLIVFFLLYKLYSRNVVSPLKNLTVATRQLAAGDLNTRMPVDSRTEIGLLYRSFNRMAAQIKEKETRLQDFNRELETKVQERTAELESAQHELLRLERLATLGQVATSVNHEIKTPLNALSLNLQLLKREKAKLETATQAGQALDPMNELIGLLDGEINRISEILDEFVNYARFAKPKLESTEINQVVAGVVELLGQRAEKSGIRIITDLAPELPPIMLDENKLIQALINLGMNGIAATPDGGELRFTTLRQGHFLVLAVADTGSGIDPADLPRIFDPFFSRKPLGMGFGLAIVQKIVEDHGGRISCRSKAREGTVFEIRLPIP
ncbi:MAG: ATP-binding protein [Desulfurivibrionaceae bacterium]